MHIGIAPGEGIRRQPVVDAAKFLAALVIMLHHFSLYGPLAMALDGLWPAGFQALAQYGRYAVQVFLVMGGYLAAQGLMRQAPGCGPRWLHAVLQRWWRLAGPFLMAVLLTLAAHATTAKALPELLPSRMDLPQLLAQLLAHAALLHDVLGMEALTVGAWYVAIDWQLYALLSLLLCAGPAHGRFALSRRLRWVLVFSLTVLSLLVFNRYPGWDHLALYFFGSYGLGVWCAWLATLNRGSRVWWGALACAVLLLAGALWLDFRGRLLCAGGAALALVSLHDWALPAQPQTSRWLRALSERSYALFLVHFAVCLWGNAWWKSLGGQAAGSAVAVAVLLAMVVASLLLADGFYRAVERPLARRRWPSIRRVSP